MKMNHQPHRVEVYWASLLTIAAALIHFANAFEQLHRSDFLAALLFGCGLVQLLAGLAIAAISTARILTAASIIQGAGLLAWTLAHTTGLPIGIALWRPGALSLPGLFLPVMEFLSAFLLLYLLFGRPPVQAPRGWLTALLTLLVPPPVTILTWAGINVAANDTWLPPSSTITPPAGSTITVSYSNPGGSSLAMDIFYPARGIRPAPVVFNIHGGGGFFGNRQLKGWDARLRDELNSLGFVVGSIDYRLAPLYSGQDQIADAKCAVRFLRAHAKELGIAPNRIGVYGGSQGGYLAAMLGTARREAGFDLGQYLEQSSAVQAVVDMWGPTDLTNLEGSPHWANKLVRIEFSNSVAAQRASSPINYVAAGDPPFLILHGTDDPAVGIHHSEDLAQRLRAFGVPVMLVIVQHGKDRLDTPGQQPSPDALVRMVADFFDKTLAP